MHTPTRRFTSILLAVTLLLAACSAADQAGDDGGAAEGPTASTRAQGTETTSAASDEMQNGAATAQADADVGGERTDAAGEDGETGFGDGGLTTLAQPIDLGRDIVYTADLAIEVPDVAAATREASRIMRSFGGLLFGQQTSGGTAPTSTLVFRVLPEDFGDALDRLGSLGSIRNQRVSADDVTERVVDLESRITTAAASVERLRSLLESATDLEDIAQLENQLLQRETNLETLRGQLRTVQDQVALATITLTVTEAVLRPGISASVTSYPGADEGLSCPGSSDLSVDEATAATICFEITNTGDSPLGEIALSDPVLDVTLDDLTAVFAQPSDVLEPGQSMVFFTEREIDETVRLQTRVSGIVLDDEGSPMPGENVADTATATIRAVDPGGPLTFAEALERSWEALVTLAQYLVIVIATMIPFVWVIPLAVFLLRWIRREDTVAAPAAAPEQDAEETGELVDA